MGSEVEEVNRDISHNTVRTQLGRISVPGRNLQQWKRFLTVWEMSWNLPRVLLHQEQLPCNSVMAVLTNYQLLNVLNCTILHKLRPSFVFIWLPLPHFIFVRYAHTEVPVLSLLLPGAWYHPDSTQHMILILTPSLSFLSHNALISLSVSSLLKSI